MKGLVLDGGGVFGIGQAKILSIADVSHFDFFVGTSIGSVVAASLVCQNTPVSRIPEFFKSEMPKVFAGRWWRQFKPITPRYPDKKLNEALQRLLPGSFGSVKKPLFIAMANLQEQKLKVMSSTDPDDGSWQLWEVCRAAVAAETYFAPWNGFADGAIYANNPSMVAIAAVCRKLHCKVTDIALFSIGTGTTPGGAVVHIPKSSFLGWGLWTLRALLNGAANSMHEYFARSLPLKKYERVQFTRQPGWSFDNPEDMLQAEQEWAPQISLAVNQVNEF